MPVHPISSPFVPFLDEMLTVEQYGPGCVGLYSLSPGNSEDCLYLDIFAPSNANKNSKLPVYFFIQGGGLGAAVAHFNGSGLIQAADMNMITVSITYRTGAWGFLASKELKANASLNNGLRDQRRAMEWVQDHIDQFGGDPDHVVVGGQSAGAGSIVQHLVANNGVDRKLFHGAIMQSQPMPPIKDVEGSQYQYDNLVERAGCKGESDTIACLRKLDAPTFIKHVHGEPFPGGAGGKPIFSYNPVIDNDFVTGLPVKSFQDGRFIKVPMVFGDDTNEGTLFAPRSVEDVEGCRRFLKNNWPGFSDKQLGKMVEMYDLDKQEPAPYWHHVSRAYGETRYICPGIQLSNLVTQHGVDNVWNWRYDVLDPDQVRSGENVSHGSEMSAIWGPDYMPGPKSLRGENKNVVPVIQGYWTSFVQTLDPNPKRAAGSPEWKKWTGKNKMHFTGNDSGMENIPDDKLDRCKYLAGISLDLQM